MADIFEKLIKNYGPIGQHRERAHGYFAFPKLEGEINSRMMFRGKEKIVWSLNNYLGLANHPRSVKWMQKLQSSMAWLIPWEPV
jgi:glycine C-acetyltransferase